MPELLVAFITGFTTGGLSCMAVQGGLLATSIANQIESDITAKAGRNESRSFKIALPILLFLVSKLTVYTLLGALLGSLGQVLRITPLAQAILQFAIALFMLGNALRMLNVHPIFRYFSFEPPAAVTRFIRRKAKGETTFLTPILLGALTVLIPCGVTQAMMAAAIATGNPLSGAGLMFAFTLGTSPVFFCTGLFCHQAGCLAGKTFGENYRCRAHPPVNFCAGYRHEFAGSPFYTHAPGIQCYSCRRGRSIAKCRATGCRRKSRSECGG